LESQEILVAGKAVAAAAVKVVPDVTLQFGTARRVLKREIVQHEFGNGVRGLERFRLDMGFHGIGPHVEPALRLIGERSRQRPQVKLLPLEMAEHAHAISLMVLQGHCEDASRLKPAREGP
jgi:hypothetical protein